MGLVSHGPTVCGSKAGATYVNVAHYLDWIRDVRLKEMLTEYQATLEIPSAKIDDEMQKHLLNRALGIYLL